MTTKEAVAVPAAVKPPRPNKEEYQKVNIILIYRLESPLVAKVMQPSSFHKPLTNSIFSRSSSCLIPTSLIPSPSLVNGATDRENHFYS